MKLAVEAGKAKAGRLPRVIVIGALGRCGRGAVDAVTRAGVPEENILKWDMAETAKGGPFPEITESDIFVNCRSPVGYLLQATTHLVSNFRTGIYLSSKIPPFVTLDSSRPQDATCL